MPVRHVEDCHAVRAELLEVDRHGFAREQMYGDGVGGECIDDDEVVGPVVDVAQPPPSPMTPTEPSYAPAVFPAPLSGRLGKRRRDGSGLRPGNDALEAGGWAPPRGMTRSTR